MTIDGPAAISAAAQAPGAIAAGVRSRLSTVALAWRGRLHLRLTDILAPGIWLFLIMAQSANTSVPPAPSTVLLVLINTVTLWLFLTRRRAKTEPGRPDMALALGGTFLVAFLRGGSIEDTAILPAAIETYALIGWGVSLISLGRSFGLAPADRGLVQRGPYQLVRHPIYAFEFLFFVGYALEAPTLRTLIILSVWSTFQVIRILREEAVIEGYEEYKTQTKWRLIPLIW